MNQKTYTPKAAEIERKWYVVDAEGQVLGRLATQIATILRGKHKPIYTPNLDTGDYVIVINADKVRLSGNKEDQKMYYRHSFYPGGLREIRYREMKAKHPDRIIKLAVKGMLPKTTLAREQLRKLRIYTGAEHPHAGAQPVELSIKR
jgi:large subunit ribosomal protein L13